MYASSHEKFSPGRSLPVGRYGERIQPIGLWPVMASGLLGIQVFWGVENVGAAPCMSHVPICGYPLAQMACALYNDTSQSTSSMLFASSTAMSSPGSVPYWIQRLPGGRNGRRTRGLSHRVLSRAVRGRLDPARGASEDGGGRHATLTPSAGGLRVTPSPRQRRDGGRLPGLPAQRQPAGGLENHPTGATARSGASAA